MTTCSTIGPSHLKAKKLRNPFLMNISQDSLHIDNYQNGISFNIVCEASFWVFSFWCIDIMSLHQRITQTEWSQLKNSLIDNKFLDNFLYSNDLDLYKNEYKTVQHKVTPPPQSIVDTIRQKAVTSNRSTYPLVILLVLNDNEIEHTIEGDDIVLLVSVVHLKDNIIPLETSIIASFIKRKCGTVLNLHDLFISTEIDEDNKPSCVICFTNTITLALLPCRHACLCWECFPRVNNCPLCRFPIQSCIALDQPDPISSQAESCQSTNSMNSNSNSSSTRQHESESFLRKLKKTLFG